MVQNGALLVQAWCKTKEGITHYPYAFGAPCRGYADFSKNSFLFISSKISYIIPYFYRKSQNTPRKNGGVLLIALYQTCRLYMVGTPRCEAGTPFHTPAKAIPAPIRLTALVAELCQGNLHNGLVSSACERPPVWVVA